ncbi:hypothetical protein GX441_08035 [bacterium]|nr:hypothetical protein [bacterium]
MKRNIFLLAIVPVVLFIINCDSKDRQLREALAQHAYEIGFVDGMIFTMEAAAGFLAGTLSSSEIDVEFEALDSWRNNGVRTLALFCDSAGLVLDSSLSNALQGVYRLAFSDGIREGDRYVREEILGDDTTKPKLNEQELAKASFKAARMDYISLLEEVDLKRKPRNP